MERNYKVGDIVRIDMKTGIYQVVAERNPEQVYVRRIFDSKLNFRLGKAALYGRPWLHGLSKVFEEKVDQLLRDNPEIAQAIADVKLDPEFNYYTWFFSEKETPFFIVKNGNLDDINKYIADEIQSNPCNKRLIKILKTLKRKKLIFPVTTRLTNNRQGLKDDESVCRIECGRYETDFDKYGEMTFSTARLYIIKNTGVSNKKVEHNNPIGFIE
ncbi:MAG: hypothetical protein K2M64_01135 [Clostridia bacterium]|nr:hypothetical protein [Clostridia bacterium]